ncbi:type VII secretion-associated serine protease mycosin [Streptomyces harbinensis]|uniref:Type VII secretion-associated serine protease mycosin n=1 Tax=Streptomyces harbinensis TaxID=1176198 RepID=A0A1I6VWQ2_9ACTN|nr:type VII secretion-associated serine protease mycosin [Streptomyces harbinensis]SFT18109.1 type VII secretion-associated serine protease mycosin [Streptomyces harbinensis]
MGRRNIVAACALLAGALYVPYGPAGAALADDRRCTFPSEPIEEQPWSLQRVLLDRLWQDTRGADIRVAVIDSGVDTTNPQLADAVDRSSGADFTPEDPDEDDAPSSVSRGDGTTDTVGHGTKVAGIIAARPDDASGFVGLAPEATIIPVRQNDAYGSGTVDSLAWSIDHAVAQGARIINISQDSEQQLSDDNNLKRAIDAALTADVVVIASVGNDGADGSMAETYPAAYDGVLAVAASDRNNERAFFSQSGDFVGIAAPGVDMVSTVPGGGQCVDNGTSFAAPYVAGVAALLRAKYPDWTAPQVITHLQQTAERGIPGPDPYIGWGVVDPVRALTEPAAPGDAPVPDEPAPPAPAPDIPELQLGESYADRAERLGTYVLLTGTVLTASVAGTALILRDRRRRRRRRTTATS